MLPMYNILAKIEIKFSIFLSFLLTNKYKHGSMYLYILPKRVVMSKNEETVNLDIVNFKPCIYIKYRAFLPSKDNKKYFKSLSIYSTQQIQASAKTASSDEVTKNVISSTNAAVAKQRSKKKRWLSFGFLMLNLIVLAVILYFNFKNTETISIQDLIFSKINWWWILIAIGLFFLMLSLDSFRIWILIKHATGHSRPWLSFKSIVTQRFYDNITPLATGGQPFQIFYLNKRGLSASTATSVPLAKYIFGQVVYILFAVVIIISNTTGIINLFSDGSQMSGTVLLTMCWVGIGLNVLLILAIVLLSVSKKVVPNIMVGILKLCKRLHFIKDYRRTYAKVMHMVREYVSTSRMFFSKPSIFIGELISSILLCFASASIPFCIYTSMCGFDPNMLILIMSLSILCEFTAGFMPLPGGAGVAEMACLAVFAALFNDAGVSAGLVVWAMLFWRILNYYAYLLSGLVLLLYDYAIGNKKIQKTLDRLNIKK